jgi:adenylate cyclase
MLVKFFRQNLSIFVITATVSLAITLIRSQGYLQSSELSVFERMIQSRPNEPSDERIVIVGITEADIRKYQQYPFSDALYAELLEKIKLQKPRVIGLDIVRDIPKPPGSKDLDLVFKTTPNLIGAGTLPEKNGNDYTKAIAFPPILKAFHKPTAPRIGDVTNPVDEDYVVRRGFLYPVRDETAPLGMKQPPPSFESGVPSFGLAVARQYLTFEGIEAKPSPDGGWLALGKVTFYPFQSTDGGYNRPPIKGYQILLNWRSSAGTFKHVSVSEVIEDKIAPDLLKDRIVLIGAYAPSLKDIALTPYIKGNSFEQPPYGIEIHAHLTSQIVSAVLDGRPLINVFPDWAEFFWLFVWIGVTVLGISVASRFKNPILYLLIVGIYCSILTYLVNLLTFQAFLFSYWLPSFYVLLGVWSSSAIAYTYNLNSQRLKEQRERIKEQEERLQENQERLQEKQENEKKLEQEINIIKEQLLAQERFAFIGQLVGGINHHLKNIFKAMDSRIENSQIFLGELRQLIIKLDSSSEMQQEKLEILNLVLERLEYINKLKKRGVSLNKKLLPVNLKNDGERAKAEWVELNSFVQENYYLVLEDYSLEALSKKPQLIEEYDTSIDLIKIVPSEFTLILTNLIINALDALEEKKSDCSSRIRLITKKYLQKISIIVQDNGDGIAPEKETEIFKYFFTTKAPEKGTGLGLPYARDFIVIHYRGDIYYRRVETEEGKETQFVVEFPIPE